MMIKDHPGYLGMEELQRGAGVGSETNSVTSRPRPKLITHVTKRTSRTEEMLMISTKANKPRIGKSFDLLTFRWD